MRRFKNNKGTVTLMHLVGMYQVHSDNMRSVTILKTTNKEQAYSYYQGLVKELEKPNDS
jgi:hypothetical protein